VTGAHRLAGLFLLLGLIGVATWRLVPRDRVERIAEWPCRHPVAVAHGQRTVVTCLGPGRPSRRQVLLAARAPCTGDDQVTRIGELLRVVPSGGGRCTVSVERFPAAMRLTLGLPVDLNQATAEDLVALPRIGPVLARRIVDHRARRGSFAAVDELRRVRGIGPVTLEHLRRLVTVGAD
jgi:competence ComEA-like helix-hairpin-helix protein